MIYLILLALILSSTSAQTTAGNTASCNNTAVDCQCKLGLCFNRAYVQTMFNRCQLACGWCGKTVNDVLNTLPKGKRSAGFLPNIL